MIIPDDIIPLNNYYVIKLIKEEQKNNVIIVNETPKHFAKARVFARTYDNNLNLKVGAIVIIDRKYAQSVNEDTYIIKSDYIVATIGYEKCT